MCRGRLHIGELSNTKHEPLAVRLRYHLRKRGVRPIITLLSVDSFFIEMSMESASLRGHVRKACICRPHPLCVW